MTNREKEIAGLRALADFLGTHPEVDVPLSTTLYKYIGASQVRQVAKALKTFKKEYDGTDFYMVKSFGPLTVKWFAARDAVCKKVVVGHKEVPEMIISAKPEQFIPASEEKVIPAHTEEITEWICSDAMLLEPETVSVVSAAAPVFEEIPF